jgi:hypothetical protein
VEKTNGERKTVPFLFHLIFPQLPAFHITHPARFTPGNTVREYEPEGFCGGIPPAIPNDPGIFPVIK